MTNPASQEVGVGTIVAGTYRIVRILGRGGMGAVWEAEHMRLPGKQVAIKVLHDSVSENPESLARFRREAEIACRLGHPNIVEVHDFNKLDNGCPYLILELLEGQDLEARLREGVLDSETCDHILRQIGSALQSAHEMGVIHRDLKPQNIFLVPSPTGMGPDVAKVLDFGISKIQDSNTVQTQNSTLLGTPQYMAPEQAYGDHDKVDGRTDLFALSAMFYELISGKPAFSGRNIPEVIYKVVHADPTPILELVPSLEAHKAAAIHKALSKAQNDRHATIGDFVKDFTGTALPATRIKRNTAAATSIAIAETIDSANISHGVHSSQEMAVAATIDSQSMAKSSVLSAGSDMGSDMSIDSTIAASDSVGLLSTNNSNNGPVGANQTLAAPVATAPLHDSLSVDMAPVKVSAFPATIAKVLAGAALAAGIVFFLMKGGKADSESIAVATLDAGSVKSSPRDAATKVALASVVDARTPLVTADASVVATVILDASPTIVEPAHRRGKNPQLKSSPRQPKRGVQAVPLDKKNAAKLVEYERLLAEAQTALREGRGK
ncbi:MAG: serine/threonine protein kinase, partial [Kofleriaceae bacterium]|nr:serine/threonine protein kinase [Kofleriaceae bacterium]